MSIWGNPVMMGGSGGGGGGSNINGFELYGAGNRGGTQTFKGELNNNYLSCCFHDNMSSSYTLNGVTKSFTKSEAGHGNGVLYGTTIPVSDNTDEGLNAILYDGSTVVTSHYDSGSYLSVVGGWIGYPSGGTIYENVSNGNTNTITLNSAHSKLLVFVGASAQGLSGTTININNNAYNVTNIGALYDLVYSLYAAIEIEENTDTTITVTFPASCYNYVSIIGL